MQVVTGNLPIRQGPDSALYLPSRFLPFLGAAMLSLLIALAVLLATDAGVHAALALAAILLLACVSAARPFLGCLALVVLPILADDSVRQFQTVTFDLGYYLFENWWKFFGATPQPLSGWIKVNAIEFLILAIGAGLLNEWRLGKRALFMTPDLLLLLAFLFVVSLMFAWGMWTGGQLKPALWQVRPYYQMCAIAFLIAQAVRTLKDLRILSCALLAAVTVKAAQLIAIFVFMAGLRFSGWREILGHEDSVFFAAVLGFLFCLFLYRPGFRGRLAIVLACAVILSALVVNLRRAGYAAFAMTMLLIPFLVHQKRALAACLMAALGAAAALYLAAFWNAGGTLGVPAEKVRSVFAAAPDTEDFSSNIYRVGENLNLWHSIRNSPLGTGFGKPFEMRVALADISDILPNWAYHPHNMILGLWMSLGSVYFIIFLTFVSGVMVSATFAIRAADHPFVKALSAFNVLAIASGFLVASLDQFIWTQRSAIFLGVVVGLVSAVSAMQGRTIPLLPQRMRNTGDGEARSGNRA